MSFAKYDARFAELSQREKVLIFVTGLVVIISIMVFLLIDPAVRNNTKTANALLPLESEILSLQQQSVLYEEALAEDPNAKLREQITKVNNRMQVLQTQFSAQLSDLILPRQMPVLIEQVFSQAEGLTLIEMASIKPVNIFADNEAMAEVPLYQHGVKLTFEGRFFAVRDFLANLERLTNQIYWRSMAYQVSEYPNAEVTLEVYTLSTEKAFIGVE